MKKLYTKLAGSDLKFSRFSFVKVLSLATAATFLSNVTPVFSANPDFRNTFLEGVKSAGVSYLQSILSVAGLNNSEDYANFLTKTLTGVSDYSPIVNVLPEASDSIRSIDMNAGSKKITRADLTPRVVKGDQITSKQDLGNPLVYGVRAQGEAHDAIVFGQVAQTKADQGIAIGLTALAGSSRNTKNSIAIGSSLTDSYDEKERTVSFGDFSIAFGSKAHSYANEAIAMGYNAYAKEQALQGVAIGASSNVTVTGGVALGSGSISDRAAGVLGYTSMLQGPAINTKAQWKSTQGAVSVGNPSKGITRQIIGVAAGSEPTDAVNVVQLKDLESVVRNGGWKLSVGGKDDTTVIMDSAVDFSAGSTNLQISKGKDNNNIKFDLAKDIAVNKVTAGSSALDATGLVISGGPKIIISGIDAGGKKITGVSDGTGANDAVNFSQLSKISESLSSTARNLETAMANTSKYFGGGAGYDKEGKWKAPDFKIKQFGEDGTSFDKNYQNVADALAGVGSSITNVQNKLTEQVNNVITKVESESFVQQDKTTSRLTIGAKVGGAEINIANESGGDRIISGVGEAKNNNDAVNKGQLDSNIKNVNDNVTNKFSELTKNITNITQQVKGDALLWNDKANAFVARHEKKQEEKGRAVATQDNSKITFLLDGDVSKDSTDAITGGQLYSLNQQLATYFGGGAGYDEQGQWKAPSFVIKKVDAEGKESEESYKSVAEAFAGVANSITNVHNDVTNVVSDSLVKQDEKTKVITIGAAVEGSEINIANSKKEDRILSGVKKAERVNEAVNKGQLDESLEKLSTSLQSDDSAVIHYDKKEGDNNTINYASVTLGKGKGSAAVALHNVADGQISKGSRDAITGGQINKIGEDVAKFLGGEAEFKDGAFKGPTYNLSSIDKGGEVTDKSHSDVGSAFKGLDENIKNVNARIKEVSEGVAQDSLSWSDGDKAFVALHGEGDDRKASKITSLAAGSIVSGSSDAVNGGQIYDLNQSLAKYFGGDAKYDGDGWVLPGFKIMTFQEDGSFVEEDYDSIAAAFSGVNKVFKNLHNEISDNIEQNALLWSDDAGAFVAQHEEEGKKENSKITFLAKGKISEDSTDAINGGQIYTLQQTFASYFGGGSGYDKEGNWQGPKFYVQVFNKDGTKGDKEERNSVSEAFDVVNDSMSNINDRIKEVEKDTSSNSLNWNKEKGSYDASHVDSQGVKSPSKIINVANGKVDRDSKEAVNGGQLWETQQMITDQVKDIENKVTEGSVQYDKDKKTGKKTNKVTLVGVDDSSPVLIDNVADGKIKKDSKEAVNGGQLKDKMDFVLESANKYTDEQISHLVKDGVSGANSYTDMKVSTLSYVVEDVRKEARQAAAVGLAVSSLRYSDIPGKLTIAFGSGLWRSQSAFAFGTGYTSENGYIGSNLSITTSGGHWGISAGVNVILN
ncbi:YadA-like family protein [Bartonella sp. AC10YNML]|uniref:YadA-like family protein n=1 Tax=Bartonella sp. AC10YNML TaxID=3243444 RepID=UPI0035CFC0E7